MDSGPIRAWVLGDEEHRVYPMLLNQLDGDYVYLLQILRGLFLHYMRSLVRFQKVDSVKDRTPQPAEPEDLLAAMFLTFSKPTDQLPILEASKVGSSYTTAFILAC